MPFEVVKLPSFSQSIFISVFKDISKDSLSEVKARLIEGDTDYDFCFLNAKFVVSREHLLSAVYRSLANFSHGQARARTLNTEIILNMSPSNKVTDALRQFGVDSSEQGDLICIKVLEEETNLEDLNNHLSSILGASAEKNVPLSDEMLFERIDIDKFKKVYGLTDAKYTQEPLQGQLTRLAIAACLLRGMK